MASYWKYYSKIQDDHQHNTKFNIASYWKYYSKIQDDHQHSTKFNIAFDWKYYSKLFFFGTIEPFESKPGLNIHGIDLHKVYMLIRNHIMQGS